jgi:small subunit ribosomal protein S16
VAGALAAHARQLSIHVTGEHFVIKLRLKRMGSKKRPSYRIVAAESSSPRDGRFIESFGIYNPIADPAVLRVDVERANHWLKVGAQPSDTVRALLQKAGADVKPSPKAVAAS